MSISEFKNKIELIIGFVARVNEADIPDNIKKPLVKAYASTLRINLSDRMVESLIETADACA